MDDLTPLNSPVTIQELALSAGMSRSAMGRLLEKHGIDPACRIGRTRAYGPVQIRRLFDVLERRPAVAV